jgi:hypothetical protein
MRHSRWGLGAGAIIAGAALAACGPGGSASPAGQSSPSSSASQANPATLLNAAYTTTTGTGTAKVALTGQIGTTVNGKAENVPITANGVIDFAHKATDLNETMAGASKDLTETRYLNGMLYQRIPSEATALAGGKQWIAVDLNQVASKQGNSGLSQLLASAPSDPSQLLMYLTAVEGQVKTVGQDTVDGAQTTHYDATIDLDKVATLDPGAASATKQLEQELGTNSLPVQLWVDQQNRLRKISLDENIAHPVPGSTTSGGTATTGTNGQTVNIGAVHVAITITMSDYGTPVNIVAPPANQTDNLTDK